MLVAPVLVLNVTSDWLASSYCEQEMHFGPFFAHDVNAAQERTVWGTQPAGLDCGARGPRQWTRARMLCVCVNGDDEVPLLCYWVCWQKQLRVLSWAAMSETVTRRRKGPGLTNLKSRWSEYWTADTAEASHCNLFDWLSLPRYQWTNYVIFGFKARDKHLSVDNCLDIKPYFTIERCFVYRPTSTVGHLLDRAMLTCLEQVLPACISGYRVISDFMLTDSLVYVASYMTHPPYVLLNTADRFEIKCRMMKYKHAELYNGLKSFVL